MMDRAALRITGILPDRMRAFRTPEYTGARARAIIRPAGWPRALWDSRARRFKSENKVLLVTARGGFP